MKEHPVTFSWTFFQRKDFLSQVVHERVARRNHTT